MKKLPIIVLSLIFAAIYPVTSFSQRTASETDYVNLLDAYYQARGIEPSDADLYTQSARLMASDGTERDSFGLGVAIYGDTAAVSTDFNDNIASSDPGTGEVFVFVRSGDQWVLQQRLRASDAAKEDKFGYAMALEGNTLLIGAWGNFIFRGKAYVFVRSNGVWTEQAQLLASDGDTSDRFGTNVALSGDTAVVGAWFAKDTLNVRSGAAYVFTRSGTTWTQQQKLTHPGAGMFDSYGIGVAVSGDELFVGCTSCDATPERPNVGLVEYFTRSGGVWTSRQKLTGSETVVGDAFGTDVAISGNTLIVGAALADIGANGSQGEAYIFTRSGSAWTELKRLTASNGSTNARFGTSVAIDGGIAVVGAPSMTITPQTQGWTYTFTRRGSTWIEQGLVAQGGHDGDHFGNSVGISGQHVISGSPLIDVNGVFRQGLAFIFSNPTVSVTVGGRVVDANGRGVHNTVVSMTDVQGQARYAVTNPFGYYRFTGVMTNATYTFEVRSKRYSYAPMVVAVTESIANLDFVP